MTIIPFTIDPGNRLVLPSTNRRTSTSHSERVVVEDTPIIDTIKVCGSISDHWIPCHRFKRVIDSQGEFQDIFTSASEKLDEVVLHVRRTPRGLEASMERSLPVLLHGDNLHPVTVGEATALVTDLHRQASRWVKFMDGPSGLRIDRLDLDRGFNGVKHVHHLLTSLGHLNVPRTKNAQVYFDAKHHDGALTLERGPRSRTWRALLYDKHAQMLTLVEREDDPDRKAWLADAAERAKGHLRFEAQLHRNFLRPRGVRTMADLNNTTLLGLRQTCFDKARFGTPVGGAARLDELQIHLATSRDPDYKYLGPVLAMVRAEALRLPQPCPAPATLAKYRRLAQKWELSAADVPTAVGPAIVLDYETGILRAA